jgi:hypothetical protein
MATFLRDETVKCYLMNTDNRIYLRIFGPIDDDVWSLIRGHARHFITQRVYNRVEVCVRDRIVHRIWDRIQEEGQR